TRPPAPNPMIGTPRDASMMTGKSVGNDVPTTPPAPAPVTKAKTTTRQATSVTGTRACRALWVALRKRLIPTLIRVPLSECRVVIACGDGQLARRERRRFASHRLRTEDWSASDGSFLSVVAPERLRKLHKTLNPCRSRVKSSPGNRHWSCPSPIAYQ